jgi:hypothetical protein
MAQANDQDTGGKQGQDDGAPQQIIDNGGVTIQNGNQLEQPRVIPVDSMQVRQQGQQQGQGATGSAQTTPRSTQASPLEGQNAQNSGQNMDTAAQNQGNMLGNTGGDTPSSQSGMTNGGQGAQTAQNTPTPPDPAQIPAGGATGEEQGAETVQGQPAPQPQPTQQAQNTDQDPQDGQSGGELALQDKTVAELKEIAAAREVEVKRQDGDGKPLKADYVRVLNGADTARA